LLHAPGVNNTRPLVLYSVYGDNAEVPAPHVLFRGITLRGWWLNMWLESLTDPQRAAALQARPCQGPAPG
jgi:hypothetical protein